MSQTQTFLTLGVLACVGVSVLRTEDFPKAQISNGLLRAEVMLPDAVHGSYSGTRFDWSGIISSIQFAGHEYVGQWHEYRGPKIPDAVTGPAEEFLTETDITAGVTSWSNTVGYQDAKPGEKFVRIGTGAIRRPPEEKAYRRMVTYDIADLGEWTIRKGPDWIEFTHRLTSDNGYSYVYRKTLRLDKKKPILSIEHSLKNTGSKAIDTTQYSHNLFAMDKQVIGPGVSVHFAFVPKPLRPFANGGEVRGRDIVYTRELGGGRGGVSSELQGFGKEAKDYDFRVENRQTGTGIHIIGDRPIERIFYWSTQAVACPEAFIRLHADPGKTARWTIRYEFYTTSPAPSTASN